MIWNCLEKLNLGIARRLPFTYDKRCGRLSESHVRQRPPRQKSKVRGEQKKPPALSLEPSRSFISKKTRTKIAPETKWNWHLPSQTGNNLSIIAHVLGQIKQAGQRPHTDEYSTSHVTLNFLNSFISEQFYSFTTKRHFSQCGLQSLAATCGHRRVGEQPRIYLHGPPDSKPLCIRDLYHLLPSHVTPPHPAAAPWQTFFRAARKFCVKKKRKEDQRGEIREKKEMTGGGETSA